MILPGSHKANFPIPPEIAECDKLEENNYLLNLALNPGELDGLTFLSDPVSRSDRKS